MTTKETKTPTAGHNNPPSLLEMLAERYAAQLDEIEDLAKRADRIPRTIKNDEELDLIAGIVKDIRPMTANLKARFDEEKLPHDNIIKETRGFFNVHQDRLDAMKKRLTERATEYQDRIAAEKKRKADEEAKKLREKAEAERKKLEEAEAKGNERAAGKAEDAARLAEDRAAKIERDAEKNDRNRSRGASGTLATSRKQKGIRIIDWDKVNLNDFKPYFAREDVEKVARKMLNATKTNDAPAGFEIFEESKASFR